MVLVAIGLGVLVVLMVVRIPQVPPEIRSVELLQEAVQRGFGGVLIVEVILFVAMIAVGRHIVQIEGHQMVRRAPQGS